VKVLVTDAQYRLALGVVRSLGARGCEVVAAASTARAVAFASRHVLEPARHPDPADEEAFVAFVSEQAEAGVRVVLPLGQESSAVLARNRDRLPSDLGLPIASADAIDVAISKRRTLELARELGVATPRTWQRRDDVEYPAVAKAERGAGAVLYLNEPADLADVPTDWLLQEYVPGEGRGLFALFDRGTERAVFMHRRVREFPVTGGASTAAEPVDDPELRGLGLRLLNRLGWHGVAMVEFKRDARDGAYKLMEINPKFWGSLDLAIAAGVDFPWLAVQLAAGGLSSTPPSPRSGFRFQWVFPDLLHAAARPRDAPAVLRDLLDPRVEKDVRLHDLKPSVVEAAYTAVALVRRVRSGTLRRPHGTPFGTEGR